MVLLSVFDDSQGERLGYGDEILGLTGKGERDAKFKKTHSPQEIPREESTKSHSAWFRTLSEAGCLPKFFWEQIGLEFSPLRRPPRFAASSKYAYTVQQPPLRQIFHSRNNSPYIRSPMGFQQRRARSARVGFEPPCWRSRHSELTNHRQAIDPPHQVRHSHKKPGWPICFKHHWPQNSSQRRNIKNVTQDASIVGRYAVHNEFHCLKAIGLFAQHRCTVVSGSFINNCH